MQINTAAHIMAVFWALLELSRMKRPHSYYSIRDVLHAPKLESHTIHSALDYLERHSAIGCTYAKHERQGKTYQYGLNPFEIPSEVIYAKPGKNTLYRWRETIEDRKLENGILIEWKEGKPLFNAYALSEEMIDSTLDLAEMIYPLFCFLHLKDPELDINREWLMNGLHHQLFELDGEFLQVFHFYICFEFMAIYLGDALKQSGDAQEHKGA